MRISNHALINGMQKCSKLCGYAKNNIKLKCIACTRTFVCDEISQYANVLPFNPRKIRI